MPHKQKRRFCNIQQCVFQRQQQTKEEKKTLIVEIYNGIFFWLWLNVESVCAFFTLILSVGILFAAMCSWKKKTHTRANTQGDWINALLLFKLCSDSFKVYLNFGVSGEHLMLHSKRKQRAKQREKKESLLSNLCLR